MGRMRHSLTFLGRAVLCTACLLLVQHGAAQAQMPSDSAAETSGIVDLQVRMDALERQLREMTGKLEEAQHRAEKAEDALAKYRTDADLRIKALEEKATSSPAVPPEDPVQTTKPPIPTPADDTVVDDKAPAPADSPTIKPLGETSGDAATAYEDAYALLKQGNHARAQAGFQTFMKAYPDHPLVANASYWHAETYYAQGDFKTAARLFADSYKKYPKGPKAADSVLKLGLSLSAAGKTQDACIALKQLDTAFKSAAASVHRRAAQEKAKIGCT